MFKRILDRVIRKLLYTIYVQWIHDIKIYKSYIQTFYVSLCNEQWNAENSVVSLSVHEWEINENSTEMMILSPVW